MFKKKVIALLLVLVLFVSSIQPVSAANVSEDIAPSETVYMFDMAADFVSLPDRTRYTYTLEQPSENYYWCTWYRSSSDSRWSYDCGSTAIQIGGKSSSSSVNQIMEVYPAGRVFYCLPYDAALFSDYDTLFSVTLPVCTETVKVTSSGSTTTYKTGSRNTPLFDFRFYDGHYNLISTSGGSCTLASKSGESTADSYGLATYTYSIKIPENTVYVVPCLKFVEQVSQVVSSSTSYTYYYTRVALGMSCSIRFDLMLEANTVDGVWQMRDVPSTEWWQYSYPVNFTCDGVSYTGIQFSRTGSVHTIHYLYPGGSETVYVDGWFGDSKKTIDFGSVPQALPIYFFNALVGAAERIGDSPSVNTGSISIKDYSGSAELFDLDSVKFPCTVAVESNGLSFTYSGDDTVSYFYEFGGTGSFVGCSLVPNDTMTRYTQGRTFTLTSSSTIYLHIEGDVSPDQPDDPDPPDPTDPVDPSEPGGDTDPTVPTDPGDSGTDSDGSGSGESADDLHGIGNGAVDDLTGAIPDYSEGFILALQDFAGAFSYEGTACSFTLPAVTMPAISDLVPKFELFPSTEFDIEPLFDLFPSRILLLVRSLLTGGLIVFCFKELYDTVSYFMTLKKGE